MPAMQREQLQGGQQQPFSVHQQCWNHKYMPFRMPMLQLLMLKMILGKEGAGEAGGGYTVAFIMEKWSSGGCAVPTIGLL